MLSKPKGGWSKFSLGKNEYSVSYLDNIPIIWLERAIEGLSKLETFKLSGDEEGYVFECTVYRDKCEIIEWEEDKAYLEDNINNKEVINISMLEFCKELYQDIYRNIDDWAKWLMREESQKNEIIERLNKLKEILDKSNQLNDITIYTEK